MSKIVRAALQLCFLFAIAIFVGQPPALAAKPPNVVLILADDLGFETVGCYGGTSYGTPNLDRLASQGVRLTRAYALPLCTNTRIQLMTGKYNSRNWKAFGILDPQATTFGHLMQRAGYKTCIAGKWQLTSYDPPDYPGAELRRNTGMQVQDAGFDAYSLWHVGHTEAKGSRYADPVIEQNGEFLSDTKDKYGPDIWTDFISDFMDKNQDDPFFVYYSMALPHNPMVPTPDSPQWSDPARRHSDETPFAADMIRYADKMVGKVVDKLDALGLRENTLILFYSDNGTNVRVTSQLDGQWVRGNKGKPTELGIRVPAIVSWPGQIPAGKASDILVDSVDILPTLLDAVGRGELNPPLLDGISFMPSLTRGAASGRDWVYIHQDPRPGWDKDRFPLDRLAINSRYKLYEDGRLYDLAKDPFESQPLLASSDSGPERAGRVQLQKVLDAMLPYPMFQPAQVPRPDPNAGLTEHYFHDMGGLVVVEAEQLPVPRDESWRVERHLPGYTGTGYLRALRSQPAPPSHGQTAARVMIDTAGPWKFAIRCRNDHHDPSAENRLWVRLGETAQWQLCSIPLDVEPGQWTWVEHFDLADGAGEKIAELNFAERGNTLWIAPASQNFKLDRIVFYQADQQSRALRNETPVSDFHPWASP